MLITVRSPATALTATLGRTVRPTGTNVGPHPVLMVEHAMTVSPPTTVPAPRALWVRTFLSDTMVYSKCNIMLKFSSFADVNGRNFLKVSKNDKTPVADKITCRLPKQRKYLTNGKENGFEQTPKKSEVYGNEYRELHIFVYFIANGLKQGLNIVSFLAKQDLAII